MSQPTTFTPPQSTHWPSSNFVLAAGTATFQPSTRKVLIIQDTSRTRPGTPRESCLWFLPRGRKDIGESIEDCAVRETLEEVCPSYHLSYIERVEYRVAIQLY
jgi:ADP-ribose pyrophosphatase YjhB (NUDIX family)